MNINLHIERLVLEAVDVNPGQRGLLQNALASELTRLLSMHGLSAALSGGAALSAVPVEPIQMDRGSTPKQMGRQIAASVYSGIGK